MGKKLLSVYCWYNRTNFRKEVKKLKINDFKNLFPDYENIENSQEDDDDFEMPYYCQKCNHNEDWPDCVIECRKWRAEL